MHRAAGLALALVVALGLAGCTAAGAGTSNFSLKPATIGWYAGDEARFTLAISSSLLHSKPSFVIDRDFAIEEIQLDESGLKFGGDYSTKDPNAVGLRLAQGGSANATNYTLDATHPSVDVYVTLPSSLRDSEYQLELKLFDVGWVKSDAFRVDHRT
jgi:hypothetical protein